MILQNMPGVDVGTITNERVKSHLQKYRANKERHKDDFIAAYDNWMFKVKELTSDLNVPRNSDSTADAWRAHNPNAVLQLRSLMNPDTHGVGEMAAYLSFTALMQQKTRSKTTNGDESVDDWSRTAKTSRNLNRRREQPIMRFLAYDSVNYPQMTDEEKMSPLGLALEHTKRLMWTIKTHVDDQRRLKFQPSMNTNDQEDDRDGLAQRDSKRSVPPWKPPRRLHARQMSDVYSPSETSVSPQTSRMLQAVADAAAAMLPLQIPGEGSVRLPHEYYNEHSNGRRFREHISIYGLNDAPSPGTLIVPEQMQQPDGGDVLNVHLSNCDTDGFSGSSIGVNSTQGYSHAVDGYRGIRGYQLDWSADDERFRNTDSPGEQRPTSSQHDEAEIQWRPRKIQAIREKDYSLQPDDWGTYQPIDGSCQPRRTSAVSQRLPDSSTQWNPTRK